MEIIKDKHYMHRYTGSVALGEDWIIDIEEEKEWLEKHMDGEEKEFIMAPYEKLENYLIEVVEISKQESDKRKVGVKCQDGKWWIPSDK